MVARADGSVVGTIGGGALEHRMTREAIDDVLPSGAPRLVERDLSELGMTCGGRVRVLIEPIGVAPRLVLFGAGHVAAEVAPLAARVGFVVAVVDDRPDFASAERFPDAGRLVHSFDPPAWEPLGLGPGSFAVVVTRGHEHDYQVVRALVDRELSYLGMMGSKKKVAGVRARLASEGVAEEHVAAIHAPIGMPIKSETPAEIAVSIVGEIIDARRRGEKA
jgi:xanthine dehydrogenase accessory factor